MTAIPHDPWRRFELAQRLREAAETRAAQERLYGRLAATALPQNTLGGCMAWCLIVLSHDPDESDTQALA